VLKVPLNPNRSINQDHGQGANALDGVPVYSPAFAGTKLIEATSYVLV